MDPMTSTPSSERPPPGAVEPHSENGRAGLPRCVPSSLAGGALALALLVGLGGPGCSGSETEAPAAPDAPPGELAADLPSAAEVADAAEAAEPPPPCTGFSQAATEGGVLAFDACALRVEARLSPFRLTLTAAGQEVLSTPDAADGGPFLLVDGARQHVVGSTLVEADASKVVLAAALGDGSSARLVLGHTAEGTLSIRLEPSEGFAATAFGLAIASPADEAFYGLTERIVDDWYTSEVVPEEVGTLNRRGETVTMWVMPTMSGYAPFCQSSRGYGLLVDGTMPGVWDVCATRPDRLLVEHELAPSASGGTILVFHGPSHGAILERYTRLTGRPGLPPSEVFLHWRGRDEYRKGATAKWHGLEINADVARDLAAYEEHGLPPGIFHFDRPWAVGSMGYGELVFDPERFPGAAAMLSEMREAGWRNEVWVSPWVLDAAGEEAKAKGLLAPGSPRSLDFTNPAAVAFQQGRLAAFMEGPEGKHVDGWFLDRGDEGDVPSTEKAVYFDGRNGREMHNAYPVLYAQVYREAMDAARPDGRGFLLTRPAYTGSQAFTMRWGGDTPAREGLTIPEMPHTGPSTDLGLRSVLVSLQRAAFMGTAYWGSDIGGYSGWIDREVYARWIEVGAASPLMRFHGQGGAPWDPPGGVGLDVELLAIYDRYVRLHHSLQGYLVTLAQEAHETGMPLARPLVFTWPEELGARDRWDEWTLGPDLLVAPVWRSGERERTIWFPPGRFVDFWDRQKVEEGPAEAIRPVPLDVLPLYIRDGSPLLSLPAPP